jgi:hypothetical protein
VKINRRGKEKDEEEREDPIKDRIKKGKQNRPRNKKEQ